MDALAAPLTAAAQRNFQRWPNLGSRMVGPFITDTTPTWAGQVQVMRTWMTQRAAWLDGASAWGGATSPSPSAPSPSAPPASACTATWTQVGQWTGGFQGEVRVTAGTRRVNGWTVTLTFANGQRVSQLWNGTMSAADSTVTVRNAAHNGALDAGASTTFGLLGSWNGSNTPPAVTCTAVTVG